MKQWNKIYKKHGKVFLSPEKDIKKIALLLKKQKVEKVLDLGCGSGRHSVFLARRKFKVYSFDIAEEGIKIAREWLKRYKLKAKFKVGSIYKRLPYGNDFFDAVISTNTIHHNMIGRIRKAIKEIERVLKPNGLIFITVRKRKLRRMYSYGTVIEKYGKQKSKYKIIAPRTYVPIEGGEKGLAHYLFNKNLIRKEFGNFEIINIWVDSKNRHYCFVGKLRSKK